MQNFFFNFGLLILGMIVIRFGVIQLKKNKEGKIKIKKNIFEKIFIFFFFLLIMCMIIYSITSFFK